MRLRTLQEKDIPLIYEWMKDDAVNRFFQFDPAGVTLDTIASFVQNAQQQDVNLHLACVDDKDVYQGTISLKNIDLTNRTAEYAVSIRPVAQGTGIATFATMQILAIAFTKLSLFRVYLNVYADNSRAIRFYEKIGFHFEGEFRQHILARGERKSLRWYSILQPEWAAVAK